MRNLRATTCYSLRVQLEVDLGHGWIWQGDERGICGAPRLLELRVPLPATVGTGPMARSKRDRLIEEEQLGPRVGAEDHVVNASEAKPTSDPSLASPERDDLLVVVVQDSAIPQPCTTRLNGVKSTERIDTVLKRHHLFLLAASFSSNPKHSRRVGCASVLRHVASGYVIPWKGQMVERRQAQSNRKKK